jgi:hypothetical protein
MHADADVSPGERALVDEYATALGVDGETLALVAESVQDYLTKK